MGVWYGIYRSRDIEWDNIYILVFEMNPTTSASKFHSTKMYSSKFICKIIQEFEPAS